MGLYTEIPKEIQEVDIIVAGGGTAGCIVAARLAEADPNLSILVIEGGQNNHNVPQVVYPALYLSHLKPTSKATLFYKSAKADQLAGREVVVASGGTLGGGSSINFLMYTRAQRSDFDSWGAKGWSAEELRPYLNKFETYHGSGESRHHGHDGPIHVSDGPFPAPKSAADFIGAAAKLGWPKVTDLQTLDANNGIGPWLRYMSPEGKRQDTAHTYIHPRLEDGKHPNLHVLVESKVVRVLIDDQKRAVGVEYTSIQVPNAKLTVKARRLVVVSCGALGTPLVLERSGLGDPEVLNRAGVPLVMDLPGVGREYQDHNATIHPYRTNLEPHETLDGILSGRADVPSLIAKKEKILGWNGIDVASKLRPSEADVDALGLEFRATWDRDFKNNLDRPLMIMGLMSYFLGDHSTIPEGQYATVLNITAYPYSRGHMHITGPSLDDPLDFNVGFFTDADDIDLKKQLWAYKKQREIMRRTAMYRGELAMGHPPFPEGSAAACIETDAPLKDVQDIKYSAEDDKVIEDWLRFKVASPWHSLGTAKMGPRESFGVVDEQLSVHGIQGLKIADMSVSPKNMGANTENAALVIGEKAADIIISELGLKS
ncbi:hypothetical protein LRP88_12764 [Fusarium phalaenopsidis]|nr:GMC-OxRdtase-N domain-containing protein [Fusarium sp. Ph1]